jgi:hypothetical protein
MSGLNRQLFEAGERNVAVAAELGQVQSELGRARAVLTAPENDSRRAAARRALRSRSTRKTPSAARLGSDDIDYAARQGNHWQGSRWPQGNRSGKPVPAART